jgi:tetratricopeptide (TPR) repeat protein
MYTNILAKINKITNWQAALVIAVLGFAVYSSGLTNPFQGDDISQIVNNVPVHSITHIKLLFEGGTFYNGQGLAPLIGAYFRPLMMAVFSLIYTLFGPHPFYFHLLQIMLYIGSTIILYLFFRYSFKPAVALFLSLVFLVHPINSQVVFSIANMQDVLFFFFGILAIYLLLRYKSAKSLLLVAVCLFLSLLAKETAIMFVAMALLYLLWWDRKRLYAFAGTMVLPLALWLILKIHAVGLHSNPHNAPIDFLSLGHRLLTAPSLVLFYITKLVFPWKLASGYYWVYSTFSIRHVLLPIVIDLAVVACVVYLALVLRRKAPKAQFYTYLFFASWCALGLLPNLQIIPLDFTAAEYWFYFSMVGVLGMIGVLLKIFPLRIKPEYLLAIALVLIGVLGLRTALRGLDYRTQYTLARQDIVASPENYMAFRVIGTGLYNQSNYRGAEPYLRRSVDIYAALESYNDLGLDLENQGNYYGAEQTFIQGIKYGIKYGNYYPLYDNLGTLILEFGGNQDQDQQYLMQAVRDYPQDSGFWMDLALFEAIHSNNTEAKIAISQAVNYGQVNQIIYNNIINNRSFTLILNGKTIKIP